MTTGKIIALTRRTFVGKVMSLLHYLERKIAFSPFSLVVFFFRTPDVGKDRILTVYLASAGARPAGPPSS